MTSMTVESISSNGLKPFLVRRCSYIGCNKTEIYTGRWKQNNKYLCHKHYSKIIYNPKRTKDQIKQYNTRRTYECQKKYNDSYRDKIIVYKHKSILLTFSIHKWQCEWCGKRKGDKYVDYNGRISKIKKIDIHHIEYFIIFPWFMTVELCNSCHTTESERLKKCSKQLY